MVPILGCARKQIFLLPCHQYRLEDLEKPICRNVTSREANATWNRSCCSRKRRIAGDPEVTRNIRQAIKQPLTFCLLFLLVTLPRLRAQNAPSEVSKHIPCCQRQDSGFHNLRATIMRLPWGHSVVTFSGKRKVVLKPQVQARRARRVCLSRRSSADWAHLLALRAGMETTFGPAAHAVGALVVERAS